MIANVEQSMYHGFIAQFNCRQDAEAFRGRTGAFRKITKKYAELGKL